MSHTQHDEVQRNISYTGTNEFVLVIFLCICQTQQIRKTKREEALNRKRSRGASGSPPFLVVSHVGFIT